MFLDLPLPWIAVLNVVLWPLIQLGLAWGFTRMPVRWFDGPPRPQRGNPEFYERWFHIRKWKARLPDGAAWFAGGFAKGGMDSADPEYLRRFIAETRRGEACHLCALAFTPLFFLWNPWWGNVVVTAYALAANLPCILAQRYNRLRLAALLQRAGKRGRQASRIIPDARSTG